MHLRLPTVLVKNFTAGLDIDKTDGETGGWIPSLLKQAQELRKYEPPCDKTNKMTCAPSKDSDQPGHPSSLITVHCALNR